MKPSLFIGSSSEGLRVAEGIEQNLCEYSEVTIWNKGVFGLNIETLEALVQATDSFDFAILVITPDDVVTSREITKQAPRDNVMFELGLFMGRLGRNRVFAFHPSGSQMKLPSDLAGVTLADYNPDRSDRNWQAATSPWCTRIRNEIERLGVHPSRGARQLERAANEIEGVSATAQTLINLIARSRILELELIRKQFGAILPPDFTARIVMDLEDLERATNPHRGSK